MTPIPPASAAPARLREAAQAFEAQAMAALLAPMFATVTPGAFGGGAAEAQWRPMLVEQMAAAAARGGRGLGLAEPVLREMLRWQSASAREQE